MKGIQIQDRGSRKTRRFIWNTEKLRIRLMFFAVGLAGMAVSFTRLRKPGYRELDRKEKKTTEKN